MKRGKKEEEEEEDQPSGMDSLPHDIALNIISRLPVTSVIQFRFVCRAWHKLSHDPLLIDLQLSQAAKDNPFLIFQGEYDHPIRNELYLVELPNRHEEGRVLKVYPPFCDSTAELNVVGSCDGLLCIWDSYANAVYIYNPFTRNYRELPKSNQLPDQNVDFGFGFDPKTNLYKVVKMVHCRIVYNRDGCSYSQSEVQVLSLGSNTWRSVGEVPYCLERRSSEAPLVNGRLHWLTRNHPPRIREIVSFDLADEKFRDVPKPDCVKLKYRAYPLAVLGGCLAAIVRGSEIWVMKEYNVKESWVKVFNVGAYWPSLQHQGLEQSRGILIKLLCPLKNGELLLEYKGSNLASYDPKSRKFKQLNFPGMPNLFRTVVLAGSLNWIDIPLGR
ncbi:hypothetical protein RJ640_011919 [Escallonia rubra]|uniref:F-box domain-containing protein n=1 Tax=Escallonia rubra TaxID=112253 RepID=A0AA88RU61_9ASTE|nr:hypothetical protein RJ640_011919 [Escallonia rubra]